MNFIKCPMLGMEIRMDETEYNDVLSQEKNREFVAELTTCEIINKNRH